MKGQDSHVAGNFVGAATLPSALLAWFVFHENADRRIALGMLAIVVGSAVLGWQGYASWGGVLGLAAIAAVCVVRL